MDAQFQTDQNFNSRVRMHRDFSANKTGFLNWAFSNYNLSANCKILELGCGTGQIWKDNSDKIPTGIALTLSDISPGMLDSARANTAGLDFIKYQIIDARDLPYERDFFDAVIANHTLMFIPEIEKALAEIARVLKLEGVFYATAVGEGNIKELIDIFRGFNASINYGQDYMLENFSLENGGEKLRKYFAKIEMRRYGDSFHITEPGPLIDYFLSTRGIGNIGEVIKGEKIAEFSAYIKELIEKKGCIDAKKDAGMFIASASYK